MKYTFFKNLSHTRKALCLGLTLSLILEGVPLPVQASDIARTASEFSIPEPSISAGDISDFVGTGDGEEKVKGTTDAPDTVSDGDNTDPKIVYSGNYRGIEWTIDETGFLFMGGEYDKKAPANGHWRDSSSSIRSIRNVKITTQNVTTTDYWFSECRNLESVDVSEFDSSQVTSMESMFWGCTNLVDLDLSGLDTSNVTSLYCTFKYCINLQTLNLSGWDVHNVQNFTDMIADSRNLTEIKTPLRLSHIVNLPYPFVDEAGKTYNALPRSRETSLTLTAPFKMIDEGIYHGMQWSVTQYRTVCTLTLSGEYQNDVPVGSNWAPYAPQITEAVISVQNVEDTSEWFKGCSKLTELDLSTLDTGKVTDMHEMFNDCSSLKTLDVSSFDTSHVTDMHGMFNGCSARHLDLSGFDTSQVTDMSYMFYHCSYLDSLDLSTFNTDRVTDMNHMFGYVSYHNETPIQGLNQLNTSQVTNMSGMFENCNYIPPFDLNGFDTSHVTDMSRMFFDCRLDSLDLSNLNTSQVSNMHQMFAYSYLGTLNISSFDTAQVTDMSEMFYSTSLGSALDLSFMDTRNVISMQKMFKDCRAPSISLENLQNPAVTDMSSMFERSHIRNLNLTGFDTSHVETMSEMFYACYDTEEIDVSCFDTSHVTTMASMFGNCSKLKQLDLHSFNTESLTDCAGMFGNCSSLSTLDLSSFDLSNMQKECFPFYGCEQIMFIRTPKNVHTKLKIYRNMNDEAGNCYYFLPMDLDTSIEIACLLHWVSPLDDMVYTGKAVKPQPQVYCGMHQLTLGKDYTLSYKNNINIASSDAEKAPTVIINGKGYYTGTIIEHFSILPRDLTDENIVVSQSIYPANDQIQKKAPTITNGSIKLVAGKDFSVEFPDDFDGAYRLPGSYNMIIHGEGNYQGTISASIEILADNQIPVSRLKISKIPTVTSIPGTPATPAPRVMYKNTLLQEGIDYSLSYENNDKPGTAVVTITGLKNINGHYISGSISKTFVIKGISLKRASFSYDKKYIFTGEEIRPDVTVIYNDQPLQLGRDYVISYVKNVDAGTATMFFTGCGSYNGTVKKTFTIKPLEASSDQFDAYCTEDIIPFNQLGAKPAVTVKYGDIELICNKDYTVAYKNNKEITTSSTAQKPTAIITGKGSYRFNKEVSFMIGQKSLADDDVYAYAPDQFYRKGKVSKSKPVVKDASGRTLKLNKDYKILEYKDIVSTLDRPNGVGYTKVIEIQGLGNYTGEKKIYYSEAQYRISWARVYIAKFEYNGDTIMVTNDTYRSGSMLVYNSTLQDYLELKQDFTIVECKNNTSTGTATLKIRGCGDYGGERTITFKIVKNDLSR